MNRLFVYGTLKKGFCRHDALSACKFLGLANTEPLYKLIDLGDYPGLISSDNGISIEGELYEVDDPCLQKLDAIEGVEMNLYSRETVQLLSPWDDKTAITYIYRQSTDGYPEIQQWTR